MADPFDLQKEPFSFGWRNIVSHDFIMKVTDQVCQSRIPIAEIDHHQRDCRKQNTDNKNILFHGVIARVGLLGQKQPIELKQKKKLLAIRESKSKTITQCISRDKSAGKRESN